MKIITISREFGSGGRELGRCLAKNLGFDYYDKEIITALANETNLNEKFIENTLNHNIFPSFTLTFGNTFANAGYTTVRGTGASKLLVKETQIIKSIAEKGRDFVIVGRNADLLLKEHNPLINLFIYADMEAKLERCFTYARKNNEIITEKEMIKKIQQIDKRRANHRQLISDSKWGDRDSFNLCLNSSGLKTKDVVIFLEQYVNFMFEKNYRFNK